MCINWSVIILSIFLSNLLQFVFEASLYYSLEILFTPTPLEKLQYPERFSDSADATEGDPDQKKELDCGKVMGKCVSEILFIGSYIFVLIAAVIGLNYSVNFGNPQSIMLEFFIGWALDQAKSIPLQFCIYWLIIRRLGLYENVNLIEWDDEAIAERGPDISLMQLMRNNLAEFLEQ